MVNQELSGAPSEVHEPREACELGKELASPEDVAEFMGRLVSTTEQVTEAYREAMKVANEEMMDAMRPPWFPKKAWLKAVYGITDLKDLFRNNFISSSN